MKELHKMTLKELHEEQAGELLIAIGRGDFRSALYQAMELAMCNGYERGKKAGKEAGQAEGETERKRLRDALVAIQTALAEPAGGEYWTARAFLDHFDIYHDDLSDLRVLNKVAEVALEKNGAAPMRSMDEQGYPGFEDGGMPLG